VLGPSEGGLGGQDAPDGFPASGGNAYPSGANAFFADGPADPRSRWQIPPQPLLRSCISLRGIVGLDASYATV